MIKFNEIMDAVEQAINNSPDIKTQNFTVTRSQYVNSDPQLVPWIGIYRNAINYNPHAMGRGANNWLSIVMVDIMVQSFDADSGVNAEIKLEEHTDLILEILEADRTLGGKVQQITGYELTYLVDENMTSDTYFQMVKITVTMEVRA